MQHVQYFERLPLPREYLVNNPMAREVVASFDQFGVIRWNDEPFTLKSGIKSNIYVFGRNDLTENTSALRGVGAMLSRAVWDVFAIRAADNRVPCVIGIPTAGTALAAAAALDPRWGNFAFRVMREMKKEHGVHKRWTDGVPDPKNHLYATIDNVSTDGASKKQVADLLAEDGYPAASMRHIVLVDRQQGAVKKLAGIGISMTPVFNLLDITWALGELRLWPKDRIKAVEDEIAAHQVE